MDLSAWIEATRVRDLLDLIDQLGPRSRFRTALVNDPEYAAAVVAAHEATRTLGESDPWTPDYAEYGLLSHQLHDMRELLVQLINVTLQTNKQKPSGISPFPSPVTAIDLAREDLRATQYGQSLSVFSPRHAPHAPDPTSPGPGAPAPD